MSVLAAKLDELGTKAAEVRNVEVSDQLSRDVQVIADGFRQEREYLEPLIRSLGVLRTKGVIPKTRTGEHALAADLRRVVSEFNKDTKFLIDNRFNPSAVRTRLRNLATQLRQTLLAAWQQYMRSRYSPPEDGLLQQLERLPNLTSHVRTIRGLAALASKHSNQLPLTDKDVESFDEQTDRLVEAMSRLKLPDSVRKFLVAVSQGGAPLNLLDESVREWLKDNELDRQFLIRSLGALSVPTGSGRR